MSSGVELCRTISPIIAWKTRAGLDQLASAAESVRKSRQQHTERGVNGVELAQSVTAVRPQTSIIFMTGEDQELPGRTLHRPFEMDDLLAEIMGALIVGRGHRAVRDPAGRSVRNPVA